MSRIPFVQDVRFMLKMSQSVFAKELKISQAYVSIIESGARDISFEIAYDIKRLAKRHGIKLRIEDIRPDYALLEKKSKYAKQNILGDEVC